jgi:hypothetical protein
MHYVSHSESTRPAAVRDRSRLQSLAMIAVFDIAGPLVAYWLLRSNGLSAVTSLVLSGVFPAVGVAINFVRDRRLDAIGVLVLAGIVVGTVLGLVSGNARLVLVEGSVPTAVFGVLCLGSLWSSAPLMYRLASEFIGVDTPRGRGTAFAISKVMPYVVAGVLAAWTFGYGNWSRRRGERAGVLAAAAAQTTPLTRETGDPEPTAEPPP